MTVVHWRKPRPWRVAARVARGGAEGFAYRLIAHVIRRRLEAGRPCPRHLALGLLAAAPARDHRQIASDLCRARKTRDVVGMRGIATTARCAPDLRAEKLVSQRYRFVWICNPKVASRSLIAALGGVDPDAVLVRGRTMREIYRSEPQTRDYLSFAFVRNPYTRAHSFYADKLLHAHRKQEYDVVRHHHGIEPSSGFGELCAWLSTPYGSDAFADRHWLSQHTQIRLPTGRLPDFVGRYERLEGDLAGVAGRLRMPAPTLPVLNAATGWQPRAALAPAEQKRRVADLNDCNRALLRARYAADFDAFGYRS